MPGLGTGARHGVVQPAQKEGGESSRSPLCFAFLDPCGATPVPRHSAAAAAVGDRLFVYGGQGAEEKPLSQMHIFNAGTHFRVLNDDGLMVHPSAWHTVLLSIYPGLPAVGM